MQDFEFRVQGLGVRVDNRGQGMFAEGVANMQGDSPGDRKMVQACKKMWLPKRRHVCTFCVNCAHACACRTVVLLCRGAIAKPGQTYHNMNLKNQKYCGGGGYP